MQYTFKTHEIYVSQKKRLIQWFDSNPQAYAAFRSRYYKRDVDDYLKEHCDLKTPLKLAKDFSQMGCDLFDVFSNELDKT